MPLVTADFISLILVIYVFVRLSANHTLKRRIRNIFIEIGIAICAILAVDEIWEVIFLASRETAEDAFRLNAIQSLEYLLFPFSFLFMLGFGAEKRSIRSLITFLSSLVLILLDLLNIVFPIVFTYADDLSMSNTSYSLWIYLGSLVLLAFILYDSFLRMLDADRENITLIIFVVLIGLFGMLSCYLDYDIVALWECISIAYLLLYLAVARAFDKTDQVTGLPNRNSFTEAFFFADPKKVTLVSFDLNHLKNYNDAMGHSEGDAYLRAFSLTMRDRMKECGKLYRTGGDEFCLLSEETADALQGKIKEIRMEKVCDPAFGSYPLDFAFGVAQRKKGESTEDLYRRADHLMYLDKRNTEENPR